MSPRALPTLWDLTPDERNAVRCIWCGGLLGEDAVYAGIAVGYWGAHNRSVGVYACPDCAKTQ